MNREEMIKRVEAGYDPIDVSIEKWVDIKNGKGRDDGTRNCAMCYTHVGCSDCLLAKIGKKCIDKGSAYDKYYHNKKPENAQLMIDALKKAKRWQEEQNCKGDE